VLVSLVLVAAAGVREATVPAASTAAYDGGWATRALLLGALASAVVAGVVATRRRRGVPPDADPWHRVPRALAWALVLGWFATSVVGVATSERSASFGDLESDLRTGAVDQVVVTGALPPDAVGSALVEVRWRDGWLLRTAEVRQVTRRQGSPDRTLDGDPVVRGDVAAHLAAIDPAVRVETGGQRQSAGLTAGAFGWTVSGWLAWPYVVLVGLTLRVLAVAPEPWRATRWGWGWPVVLLAPLGSVAFLLLGGPTRAVRRPEGHRARLTGGWSFLAAVLVASAFDA
jgi:hypothetical protein